MAKFKDYDDYIAKCEDFAQPILSYLRSCVHEACPDAVEEFKWSFPCFTYKKSILCHMAGFKKHATFGFWLAKSMDDPQKILNTEGNTGMGNLGKINSIEDLPDKAVLIQYIQQAVLLTDQGVKLSPRKNTSQKTVDVPEILIDALDNNILAAEHFNKFSPSQQREYTEWIDEAKTEKTQLKRLDQAIEWLSEGKPRNWKYMKKWM